MDDGLLEIALQNDIDIARNAKEKAHHSAVIHRVMARKTEPRVGCPGDGLAMLTEIVLSIPKSTGREYRAITRLLSEIVLLRKQIDKLKKQIDEQ